MPDAIEAPKLGGTSGATDELGDLVDAVLTLLATDRSDARAIDLELALIDACETALEGSGRPEPNLGTRAEPGDLAARIAELAADGKGVRAIARALGVSPSTVSRRLRKALPKL